MAAETISIRLPKDTQHADKMKKSLIELSRRINYLEMPVKEYLQQIRDNLVSVEDMKWLSENDLRFQEEIIRLHHGYYGVQPLDIHGTHTSSLIMGMHLGIMPSILCGFVKPQTTEVVKTAFKEYQRTQQRRIPDSVLAIMDTTCDFTLIAYLLRYYGDDLDRLNAPLWKKGALIHKIRDSVCP